VGDLFHMLNRDQEWMTTDQVKKYLGIETHHLRTLRRRGRLTAYELPPNLKKKLDIPTSTNVYRREEVESVKEEMAPKPIKPS